LDRELAEADSGMDDSGNNDVASSIGVEKSSVSLKGSVRGSLRGFPKRLLSVNLGKKDKTKP